MVSKAEDMSIIISAVGIFLSKFVRMSSVILNSAVSVEKFALYADCRSSKRLFIMRCSVNWVTTIFSKTLDKKGKWEIGL